MLSSTCPVGKFIFWSRHMIFSTIHTFFKWWESESAIWASTIFVKLLKNPNVMPCYTVETSTWNIHNPLGFFKIHTGTIHDGKFLITPSVQFVTVLNRITLTNRSHDWHWLWSIHSKKTSPSIDSEWTAGCSQSEWTIASFNIAKTTCYRKQDSIFSWFTIIICSILLW